MKQGNAIVRKAAVTHSSQDRGMFGHFCLNNVHVVVCVQTLVDFFCLDSSWSQSGLV